MAGGWGCPHEVADICTKINNLPCNPGMKGCVLAGRYVFFSEDKNQRLRQKQSREHPGSDATKVHTDDGDDGADFANQIAVPPAPTSGS